LSSCHREPIHIPGSIQPHGVLLAMTPALEIIAVSANSRAALGIEPGALLGRPLGMFAATAPDAVAAAALNPGLGRRMANLQLQGTTGNPWHALLHATPAQVLLEVELPAPDDRSTAKTSYELDSVDAGSRKLQAAETFDAVCDCLVREIRELTGFDRVMIYRFSPGWDGEVIAEARHDSVPSFLGLHFPASDIPPQARALYQRNPQRSIPDVDYQPVVLVQQGEAPIDLTDASLRSVSPIHRQYLRNMGVGASTSFSILRHGLLWGLVACHHRNQHRLPVGIGQTCVLLIHLAAWQLSMVEDLEMSRHAAGVKAFGLRLLQQATHGWSHRDSLLRNGPELLEVLGASGLALSYGDSLTTVGHTPSEAALRDLIGWVAEHAGDPFHSSHLAAVYPPAAGFPEVAGVMAVKLGSAAEDVLVWFRPEITRAVTWGGDPAKPAIAGPEQLTPRTSFEAWTELVRGQSQPWLPHDAVAAEALRDALVSIIVRRSADLEQMNLQLLRSNEELDAFAHVAAHDLREPLRQIEIFGSLLERAFRNLNTPKASKPTDVARWFEGIQTSALRLRTLVQDLAEYAQLGRRANPFTPVALADLLDLVRLDYSAVIEATEATIEAGALPVLVCDRTQMQQVLQNLVSNALKYRHPDRKPVIIVAAEAGAPTNGITPQGLPALRLTVADNGIGFDDQHCELIFEPFQRLNSSDMYEGSGLGLSICRKIIERHGGTITARGRPGEGCVFEIIIPMRALSGTGDYE
jgi:light-regulated signal transduction histidine kinase (bacteriophytochrome)